jgi:hypothetical protein
MNFLGQRTQKAAAEMEGMPVDAGQALAGLSAVGLCTAT